MDGGEIKDVFEALKIGFQLFKDAIGWAKSAKDKLPLMMVKKHRLKKT